MKLSLGTFNKKLLSINEIIYFDQNDFLREKTNNPEMVREFIAEGEKLLAITTSQDNKYFLNGTLGNLYRIYGLPKLACQHLSECLTFARVQGDMKKEIVSLIRIGEALKYDSKHEKALSMFDEALTKCISNEEKNYLDFVLQHKGKCLMEMNRYEEAGTCFEKALEIRKEKNNSELIDSTQKGIDLINKLKTI